MVSLLLIIFRGAKFAIVVGGGAVAVVGAVAVDVSAVVVAMVVAAVGCRLL